MRQRLLGTIPLCFFLAHWIHHANEGYPGYILWLCNLNNLLLAAGILTGWKLLTQIGILWLLPALPLWAIESWMYGDWPLTSILSHIGALSVGLYLLPRLGMNKYVWIPALVYAFIVQQLTRLLTPSKLNVNVAFEAYMDWKEIFPHYWQFWLFVALEATLGLFLLNWFLAKRFPDSPLTHKVHEDSTKF
ncbi:MAG TPA: hypothetical protein VLH08_04400 [Acidobacteriota bacterium]|nr:hypothetical protein [Acidobacteriota bacterium]